MFDAFFVRHFAVIVQVVLAAVGRGDRAVNERVLVGLAQRDVLGLAFELGPRQRLESATVSSTSLRESIKRARIA